MGAAAAQHYGKKPRPAVISYFSLVDDDLKINQTALCIDSLRYGMVCTVLSHPPQSCITHI